MTVLGNIPPDAIIHAMRGTIDYACWRGIPYARTWPRTPAGPRSIPSQLSAAEWGQFVEALSSTHPTIAAEADVWAAGTPWAWRDLLTAAAYGNLITW